MSNCYRCVKPCGNRSQIVDGVEFCFACYLRHVEQEGEHAQKEGLSLSQNPYKQNLDKYHAFAWESGFIRGQELMNINTDNPKGDEEFLSWFNSSIKFSFGLGWLRKIAMSFAYAGYQAGKDRK